ncbi:MAG: hypothetical protein JXP34_24130 [Planctomycetes bacterium]|nr:hypothetical protein [Planctomycetota bacterium]
MKIRDLTDRERFLRFFRGQSVDRVPDMEFGYWTDTFLRWHGEGLPDRYRENGNEIDAWFDLDLWLSRVPVEVGLRPPFRAEVVSDDGRRRIERDEEGVLREVFLDGSSTIPHYLEFPLRDRASWRELRRRLDPEDPGRVPEDFSAWAATVRDRDTILGIRCGSLFGILRNWAGLEGISYLVADDRALFEEMVETLATIALRVLERILPEVRPDYAHFWEDMACRSGPLLAPRDFEDIVVPRYRQITDLLRHHGTDIVLVDCDGRIDALVNGWLDGGVNVMFPMEVRAGNDIAKLRQVHGGRLRFLGGVDKTALAGGFRAIDREVDRLAPLVERGYLVPLVDHRVPPDVSYADYRYYLERKREIFGISRRDRRGKEAT